jgi:hypothetical protein
MAAQDFGKSVTRPEPSRRNFMYFVGSCGFQRAAPIYAILIAIEIVVTNDKHSVLRKLS